MSDQSEVCQREKWSIPIIFYLCLALLLLWQLFLGHTYFPTDVLSSFPLFYQGEITTKNFQALDSMAILAPIETLFSSELKQGRFLLWNPYNFLGHPVYAGGAATFFYPVRIVLHFLFSVPRAHDIFLLLHLWASGLAGFYFLRVIGLSRDPSLTGGAIWMLCGFHVGFLALEATISYGLWTPLTFALFYRAFGPERRSDLAPVAGLACAVAGTSSGLNAWAALMVINGLWTLCLLANRRDIKVWLLAASAMAVSCLCLCMAILPILEMAQYSQRPLQALAFQTKLYLQFVTWLPVLMVVPEFFGNPSQGLHMSHLTAGGTWFFQESFLYIGLLPLFAAPLAWRSRAQFAPKFFGYLVLVSVLIMTTPLLRVVRAIPGFSQVSMTRFFYFTTFAVVVLAAFGIETLLRFDFGMARLKLLWASAAVLLALSLLVYARSCQAQAVENVGQAIAENRLLVPLVEHFSSPQAFFSTALERYRAHYSPSSAGLVWPVLMLVLLSLLASVWTRLQPKRRFHLLLLLACLDPLFYDWRVAQGALTSQFFPDRPEISFLKSREGEHFYRVSSPCLRPNTLVPYRIAQLEGYQSLFPLRSALFAEKLQAGTSWREIQIFPLTETASPLLDLIGVKYLIRYLGEPMNAPRMKPVFAYNLQVYENPSSLPLAWLVPKVSPRQTKEQVLSELGQYDPRAVALVEGQPSSLAGSSTEGEVEILKTWPGGADISVRSKKGAWLIYNEQYYPGWRAEAAGRELKIYPANLVQMAIHLEAGPQVLSLRFQPPKLRAGWMLSLLGLFVAGVSWMVGRRLRGKQGGSMVSTVGDSFASEERAMPSASGIPAPEP